jgi:septation ring formation regulator EzrA
MFMFMFVVVVVVFVVVGCVLHKNYESNAILEAGAS